MNTPIIFQIMDELGVNGTCPIEDLPGMIRELKRELDELAKHHAIVEHEVVRLRKETTK